MRMEADNRSKGHSRWPPLAAALAAAILAAPPGAAAASGHRCPSQRYWDDIVVHGMSCDEATQVHREKLRECVHARRQVTTNAYVYTCSFGPWKATERVARKGFSDRIRISRDAGGIWMRYDALP